MRVGGRPSHFPLPYGRQFPIILPTKHPLTSLIVTHFHAITSFEYAKNIGSWLQEALFVACYEGTSHVLNHDLKVQHSWWEIFPLRDLLRIGRTNGIDYAGPFIIKISRNKCRKAYICLFVCLATKAIHIKVVSVLTTSGFLKTLKRFIWWGRSKVINGLVTKMRQDFWHRWSREYVVQLHRTKWQSKNLNKEVKIGAIVLNRDITSPQQWRLGRIIEVHLRRDGLVCTVT